MPRPLRVEYEGAVYHVMNRGDRREPIFRDDTDPECFMGTLGEACDRTVNASPISESGQMQK